MKILVQCKVYELLMDFWKYLLNSAKLAKRCTWILKIFYLHDFCTQKNTRIQNFLRLLKQIYPIVLTDPAIVLFMIMIIFVIVRGQYVEFFFYLFVYICISVGDPIIKNGLVMIPLTVLTTPHLCACPKSGSGFPPANVMVFCVFNDIR